MKYFDGAPKVQKMPMSQEDLSSKIREALNKFKPKSKDGLGSYVYISNVYPEQKQFIFEMGGCYYLGEYAIEGDDVTLNPQLTEVQKTWEATGETCTISECMKEKKA